MRHLFEKPVETIDEQDLNILIERPVPEGFYIDYKQEFPPSNKLQHLVASFANTHGGWVIIGAETNRDNAPTEFPGFDLTDQNSQPKERFRHICLHISPVPRFRTRLIKKADGSHVLIAYIEESPNPPHITPDGRVYRRDGETSNPVPETDRYAIDLLYQKAGAAAAQLEESLAAANVTRDWVGYTMVVHPQPVNVLVPDLFVRHESSHCMGSHLLRRMGGQLRVGQNWLSHGSVLDGSTEETRIDIRGSISRSLVLDRTTDHRSSKLQPLDEKGEIRERLCGLLELAGCIYRCLEYSGDCRIVLFLNRVKGLGLTRDGISDNHLCAEDSLKVPLTPLCVRASELENNVETYVNQIMLEVYHAFGHPVRT